MLSKQECADVLEAIEYSEAEAEWGKHDSRGLNAARRLLFEYRTLVAEVERLRAHEPDAALGAAVRALSFGRCSAAALEYRVATHRWIVRTPYDDCGEAEILGLAATPDEALADAGLMDIEEVSDAE